ncbi:MULTISPECIES: nitrilase-related carbon-nitrogen hydrolase [unclassified Fusibacter]|uniref:nitrilase-related carbon-nitrogen hydrolase n=1 Tax=unclassified Fusibacter TaxID=2624464 RepID=UPI001012DD84|nr:MULTISPECIES: nitrilase-related carbon-nitrogen hydrolase [unclassified Fusibacter]MCK8059911.1 carbon-nitrogen hydrolase family protein [Fusibacter sp. A2]NPE22053.1 carbon-nitrogen hydrolase family protein [Fusibacter sp. A1]RXV60833.1 carbon-nitrogen hydrolase family protein [Fusibacter sp. A1]
MTSLKIGLVAATFIDGDIDHQIKEIKYYVKNNNHLDMLFFGESYIQGFEGLTWDYEKDLDIAISLDSPLMADLKNFAKDQATGISFGFIEREGNELYSSNVVIDSKGKIINLFRRVSEGWKEPIATDMYKEGKELNTFEFGGKTFTTLICGDLFHQENLDAVQKVKADYLLWPLYIDYSVKDWQESVSAEYAEQAGKTGQKVLMINSFSVDENRAHGGCYVYNKGKIEQELSLGNVGVLEVTL